MRSPGRRLRTGRTEYLVTKLAEHEAEAAEREQRQQDSGAGEAGVRWPHRRARQLELRRGRGGGLRGRRSDSGRGGGAVGGRRDQRAGRGGRAAGRGTARGGRGGVIAG